MLKTKSVLIQSAENHADLSLLRSNCQLDCNPYACSLHVLYGQTVKRNFNKGILSENSLQPNICFSPDVNRYLPNNQLLTSSMVCLPLLRFVRNRIVPYIGNPYYSLSRSKDEPNYYLVVVGLGEGLEGSIFHFVEHVH